MNTTHLTPQRLRTLQILAALAAGVCIPILGSFLLDAFVLLYQPQRLPTWRDYAGAVTRIFTALLIIAMAYRLIRRSALPGMVTIAALLGLMWANLLLGH